MSVSVLRLGVLAREHPRPLHHVAIRADPTGAHRPFSLRSPVPVPHSADHHFSGKLGRAKGKLGDGPARGAFGSFDRQIQGLVPDTSRHGDLLTAVTGVGPGTSLADKVTQAQVDLAANDVPNACSTLTAFIHEVQAQSGRKIPTGQAASLIARAQRIMTVLGC